MPLNFSFVPLYHFLWSTCNNPNFTLVTLFKISRMNYFLVHLSLADILTALLTLVPEIAWTITSPEFLGGNTLCKVVKFLQVDITFRIQRANLNMI